MATRSSTLTEKRNVLIVGKTGGGKSTVANRILASTEDRQPFTVSSDVLSSTESETIMKSGDLHTKNGTFKINVIDTVGLFDTRGTLSNKMILSDMRKFFRQHVPDGIHLIIFVFKVGRWTTQEEDVMTEIVQNFQQDISNNSALVFTACESFTKEKRKKIVDDFTSKQELKHIANLMKKGIHTVGFPDLSEMPRQNSKIFLPGVKADQEKLRELIYTDLSPCLAGEFQTRETETTSFWEKVRNSCVIL